MTGAPEAVTGEDAATAPARAPRTRLLLAATIEDGDGRRPVRIRNLSEGGAMIEGPWLPAAATPVTLSRNDLSVCGTVAWHGGDRCGIRFDRGISVMRWSGGIRPSGIDPAGQNRVDATQAMVRSGAAPAPPPPAAAPPPAVDALTRRIADEIGYVARLIEDIGDTLADEPAVINRHPTTLQNFDLAGQILGHLAAVLSADDMATAATTISMAELRSRLLRRSVL